MSIKLFVTMNSNPKPIIALGIEGSANKVLK